jgi:hypothetical protein
MGAILAMKPILKCVLALSSILLLASCGSETQSPARLAIQSIGSLMQGRNDAAPQGPDQLLTRDVIDRVVVPYAMVGIERRGAYASMTLAGSNGRNESWVTSDGAGIYLRNGLLTGTKGLGADLLTADLGNLEGNLDASSGAHQRVHRMLDGEGRIVITRYSCQSRAAGPETIEIIGKAYATQLVVEECSGTDGAFENRYWIGRADGVMWKSRQWVSDKVGHVIVLTLVHVAR